MTDNTDRVVAAIDNYLDARLDFELERIVEAISGRQTPANEAAVSQQAIKAARGTLGESLELAFGVEPLRAKLDQLIGISDKLDETLATVRRLTGAR